MWQYTAWMYSFSSFVPLSPLNNQPIVPCLILTVASWLAYRFLRRWVRWSGIPISLRIFHNLWWSTTIKGFNLVSEAEVDIFLEFFCFFYGPLDVASLISSSSDFSKSSLHIWKFLVHVLLKSSLKDFEHYLANIWSECNCTVVWTFFGIDLLWDWNESWLFPVLWPLPCFPNLLTYWVQHLHNIVF